MLQRITLHLGRTAAHPEGSPRDGYDITAPVDSGGRLDGAAWRAERERCRVRRFRAGEPDRHGWLVHRAGGSGGANWQIDYDDESSDDDESAFKLDQHKIAVGEYLSIRGPEGAFEPFKIVAVQTVAKAPAAG